MTERRGPVAIYGQWTYYEHNHVSCHEVCWAIAGGPWNLVIPPKGPPIKIKPVTPVVGGWVKGQKRTRGNFGRFWTFGKLLVDFFVKAFRHDFLLTARVHTSKAVHGRLDLRSPSFGRLCEQLGLSVVASPKRSPAGEARGGSKGRPQHAGAAGVHGAMRLSTSTRTRRAV
jgi:hypothetical protein